MGAGGVLVRFGGGVEVGTASVVVVVVVVSCLVNGCVAFVTMSMMKWLTRCCAFGGNTGFGTVGLCVWIPSGRG